MQIVIEIPERIYRACEKVKDLEVLNTPKSFRNIIEDAIANGTLLPKGHGRLIDADELESTTIITDDFSGNEVLDVVLVKDLKDAPTIVVADKEVEDGD